MAAKRSATSDLNHDNWDREDEPEEAGTFAQASAAAMQGRVIKKAKRKGLARPDGGTSIFAGFGGFGNTSSNTANAATPESSNKQPDPTGLFSFLGNVKPGITGGSANESAKKEGSNNGFAAQQENSSKPPPSMNKGGFDFGGLQPPASLMATNTGSKWTCDVCMITNDADKDKCVCCESPNPNAAKKAEPSKGTAEMNDKPNLSFGPSGGFQFGAPKSSGSGNVGGFSFGASANSTVEKTGGFEFGASTQEENKDMAAKSTSLGVFTFGSKNDSNSESKTSSSNNSDKKTSNGQATDEDDNPGHYKDYPEDFFAKLKALNQQLSECIQKHVNTNPYILLEPIFKDYENHWKALRNEFKKKSSYNATEKSDKPLASTDIPPKVTFGDNKEVKNDKPLLGAIFGTSSKSPSVTEKKSDNDNNDSSSIPALASKSPVTAAPPTTSYSFGSPLNAKAGSGTFSFGSSKPTTGSATFSFGDASSNSNKTEFTAGFSFGAAKPSSTFPTFGSSTPSAGFSFGGATTASSDVSSSNTKEAEDEEEDEPPKVEVKTVVEEDSIHSVRCKLFYKKEKEFQEKGLGMLHLKKVEGDDKKTQLVVRAETNLGNILLNILLHDKMMIKQTKNNVNFVCVPNPAIKGMDGPVVMLVKVKTADMAEELVKKMEELIAA